ncbi:MAG: beta-glucosidase, partial [Bacteroidaceae bacterium]|nr:beta-glucosidase [Bacteroidaceae bacterium]
MKNILLIWFLVGAGVTSSLAQKYPYQDPRLPVAQRTEDLLSRMTLQEKVGQMLCMLGWDSYTIDGKKVEVSAQFGNEVDQ